MGLGDFVKRMVKKAVITVFVVGAGAATCTNGCTYIYTTVYNKFDQPSCVDVNYSRKKIDNLSVQDFMLGKYGQRKALDNYLDDMCKK